MVYLTDKPPLKKDFTVEEVLHATPDLLLTLVQQHKKCNLKHSAALSNPYEFTFAVSITLAQKNS